MYSGTYLFQASIEVTKYERVAGKIAPPFEKVTITFNNEEGEWEVTKISVKRLPNDTKLNCEKQYKNCLTNKILVLLIATIRCLKIK